MSEELRCGNCKHFHAKATHGPVDLSAAKQGECRGAPPLQSVGGMQGAAFLLSPPFYRLLPDTWPACGFHAPLPSEIETA